MLIFPPTASGFSVPNTTNGRSPPFSDLCQDSLISCLLSRSHYEYDLTRSERSASNEDRRDPPQPDSPPPAASQRPNQSQRPDGIHPRVRFKRADRRARSRWSVLRFLRLPSVRSLPAPGFRNHPLQCPSRYSLRVADAPSLSRGNIAPI
jgi:hypothetical protein